MPNTDRRTIRLSFPKDSESSAILALLDMKNKNNKSHALEVILPKTFEILKSAGILSSFFSQEIIALYNKGKSPSEIVTEIANRQSSKDGERKHCEHKSGTLANQTSNKHKKQHDLFKKNVQDTEQRRKQSEEDKNDDPLQRSKGFNIEESVISLMKKR